MTITTPRNRTELERDRLLRVARPIPLTRLQTTASTLVTARTDADFLVGLLWLANVTGGALTYSVRVVPAAGTPSAANSIAETVALAANTSVQVDFGTWGLLLEPGAFLSALCSSNDGINAYGWGYDVQGAREL